MIKDLSICELNDIYGKLLSNKQAELVRQFYYEDLSLGEIAENEGITRQAAHNAISKGVAALKGYEATLKMKRIYDMFGGIDESLNKQQILDRIQDILRLKEE